MNINKKLTSITLFSMAVIALGSATRVEAMWPFDQIFNKGNVLATVSGNEIGKPIEVINATSQEMITKSSTSLVNTSKAEIKEESVDGNKRFGLGIIDKLHLVGIDPKELTVTNGFSRNDLLSRLQIKNRIQRMIFERVINEDKVGEVVIKPRVLSRAELIYLLCAEDSETRRTDEDYLNWLKSAIKKFNLKGISVSDYSKMVAEFRSNCNKMAALSDKMQSFQTMVESKIRDAIIGVSSEPSKPVVSVTVVIPSTTPTEPISPTPVKKKTSIWGAFGQ